MAALGRYVFLGVVPTSHHDGFQMSLGCIDVTSKQSQNSETIKFSHFQLFHEKIKEKNNVYIIWLHIVTSLGDFFYFSIFKTELGISISKVNR